MFQVGIPDRSRFRGALLGGAIGDALGRPAESKSPAKIRERFGEISGYIRSRQWSGGPIGTITDDTQMTILVAECLRDNGKLDPEDLARRFVEWLPNAVGIGGQTRDAIRRLKWGTSWQESGGRLSGNGAAMRTAPIGLLRWNDRQTLREEAILSALPTHTQTMGVAGAVAVAAAVAWLVTQPSGPVDATALVAEMRDAIEGYETEAQPVRAQPGSTTTLYDRLGTLPDEIDWSPEQFFTTHHNGAFVLETLPASLYCFLRTPTDIEGTLLFAVNQGYDADTVAAIAGNFGGALMGEGGLPQRLLPELECREYLIALADALYLQATNAH